MFYICVTGTTHTGVDFLEILRFIVLIVMVEGLSEWEAYA